MENRHIMNFWFDSYLREMKYQPKDAMRAESWENIWALCFHDTIGGLYPEDLDDGVISDLWEEAELKLHNRTDLFSAFLLLRSLFSYIEFLTGVRLYDIVLPLSFVSPERELTREGCELLDELTLSYTGRIAICFWLVLHSPLTFQQVTHLTRDGFSLAEDMLTLKYAVVARPSKDGKKQPPAVHSVEIPVDERAHDMLAKLTEEFVTDEKALIFDPQDSESRKKLTSTLTVFCSFCGLPKLELADLERAEKLVCKREDEISASSEHLRALAEKLEPLMKRLPKPLLEHARRTRLLASFFTEQLRCEDWFIDLGFDEYDLLFAVYHHDLGKAALKKEDYYPGSRAQAEQNRRYRQHVEHGEAALVSALGKMPDNLDADTPEALLRDAIRDHHETLDGKGFPQRKTGDEISFVGRLCAIADALDHMLFIDDPESDTDLVILSLDEQKNAFDSRLTDVIFQNNVLFHNFVDELRDRDRAKRGADAFGVRYVFRPFVTPDTHDVVAYDAHLLFNDRYYGILDSDVILPLMEEHPSFALFTKLQIRRVLRLMFSACVKDKNTPMLFVKISVGPTAKETFFQELLLSFIRYNTRYRKIIFTFDESELIDTDANAAHLCEQFHLVGAGFAISGFGGKSTLLPQIHRIHPDYILLHPDYAMTNAPERLDFLHTVLDTAKKANIKIMMPGVDGHEAFGNFAQMGVSALGGQLSGAELSEKEFTHD